MMNLTDVLEWIKNNPNQYMVQGGKSKSAKAASAAAKTSATSARASSNQAGSTSSSSPNQAGGIDYKVGISDSAGVSEGGTYGAGIKATVRRSGGGGPSSIDVGGLTPQEAANKIGAQEQKDLRDSRMQADEEQRKFENDRREKERYKQLSRFKTQTGKYVIGGKVVQVTVGSQAELARLNKQIPESQLIQFNKDQYGLFNYTQRGEVKGGLANPAEFKKFNEKIKEQGGTEFTSVKPSELGGLAYKVGLEDSAGVSVNFGGQYGEIPEQKPAPEPQIGSSNFTYDEGGTVTFTEKKYFPRENRQQIKDFLKANPAESYNIYDEQGRIVKTTSGRYTYPDVLRATLAGPVTISPVGTETFTEKKSFTKESRQNIKDYLKATEAESYNIYDEQGKIVKTTSGRNAYPDVLKAALAGPVTIGVTPNKPFFKELPVPQGKGFHPEVLYNNAIPVLSGLANLGLQITSIGVSAAELAKPSTRLDTTSLPFKITNEGKKSDAEKFYDKYKQPSYPEGSKQWVEQQVGELGGFVGVVSGVSRGGGAIATKVGKYISDPKLIKAAIEDFSKVLAPKQTGPIKLTEKIKAQTQEEANLAGMLKMTKIRMERIDDPEQFGGYRPPAIDKSGNLIKSEKLRIDPFKDIGKQEAGMTPEKVIKHELIHKINRDLPEEKVLQLEDDPFGLTKAIDSSGFPQFPKASGLSKNIGGEGMVESKVTGKIFNENFVRLESTSPKQDRLILYNPKSKTGIIFEDIAKDSKLPKNFNTRGSFGNDIEQQIAQQNKFGLTQVDKDLFKYVKGMGLDAQGEINLIRALKSESVASIGRVKTFSLEQINQNPRGFGRFFFGGEKAPVKPISDIGLLETRGYKEPRFGTSKADKYSIGLTKEKVEVTSKSLGSNKKPQTVEGYGIGSLKSNKYIRIGKGSILRKIINLGNREPVFKAFNEGKKTLFTNVKGGFGKLNLFNYGTRQTIYKKLPTSNYVTDLLKLNKKTGLVNPFSVTKKGSFYKPNYTPFEKETATTKGEISSGKSNKLITVTQKERDEYSKVIYKQIKSEKGMDILFKGPRFLGEIGGTGAGLGIGTKQLGTYEYDEPNIQMDRGPRMIESPQAGKFDNIFDFNTNIKVETKKEKYNDFGTIPLTDIYQKSKTKETLLTGLFIDVKPKLDTKQDIVPVYKFFQDVVPIQGLRVTGRTDTKLIQELVPELTTELVPVFEPEIRFRPPPPEGKITGGGGFPFFNFGGGGDNEFSGKKSKKFYTIFDVSKVPFGKISRYVGYQEQSYSPIEEISRKSKNPIAFTRPENIINVKIGNLYDMGSSSKSKTRSKGSKKKNSAQNYYGFEEENLF